GALDWAIPFLGSHLVGGPSQKLGLVRIEDAVRCLNPLFVLEAAWRENSLAEFGRRFALMSLTYGGAGALALALAAWRLRPVVISQTEMAVVKARRLPRRRAGDDDPVRWRERTAGRGWARRIAIGAIVLATVASSLWIIDRQEEDLFILQGGVAAVLGSLVVGIRAAGTVTREREMRTWESLLLTPLD